MSRPVLVAEDLHTFYGKSHILHGVGLEVREGEIVTLLGRNGAGKTTTLRSLVGLTPPRNGVVQIFGHSTTAWPPYRIAALGVGYVPGGATHLFEPDGRGEPQGAARAAGSVDDRAHPCAFPRLAERRGNKGRQLSGGEQEMLAIARALILNPKLLILDEPSQGLAPLIVREVFKVVASAREEGISILLVEQNVRAATEIADRAYVLDDGRVVFSGPAGEFAKDEDRVRALAGASAEGWAEAEAD